MPMGESDRTPHPERRDEPRNGPAETPGDMPPEAFREAAREVVEWISDYLEGVRDLPVLPRFEPGELRSALPSSAPEAPEPFEALMRDFRERIVPGTTHWNHPSFHGYFSITGSGPGILAEMLTAALNVNHMVWRSGPAQTELEAHVLDWLRDALGLPHAFMGQIADTASSSTLWALAAARTRAFPDMQESGWAGQPAGRIYTSVEAHSSVDKAALTLGFGRSGVRHVPAGEDFRMDVGVLRAALAEDVAAGIRPVAVVATLGTTSTTAVDPVDEIARVAAEYGIWLHVDAAYGGPLALLPEWRTRFAGWERADSIVVNPHKWLFTPIDCSVLWCSDPGSLRAAFSLVPEYLRTGEDDRVVHLMDHGVALGRRFRSLKLWFVLRWFGLEGIRLRLEHHLELAREWVERVEATEGWEMVAPCEMATPIYRFAPAGRTPEEADAINLAVMERVNRSGVAFLSHTAVRGRIALRTSIGNLKTTRADLDRTWGALLDASAAESAADPTG